MNACDKPGCGKTFKNEQGLMFHKRYVHSGESREKFKSNRTEEIRIAPHPYDASQIGGHNIKDSKRGYLLCVKCGQHFDTYQQFATVRCESLTEHANKVLAEIAREKREAGSEAAWLTKQSPYVRGELDWHDTLLPEDRKLLEETDIN